MKESLLTMGMVVYNEERYVGQAIEYLLAQTFKDFILIISDNASTDATQEICKEYAKKNSRIVYVRHEKNMGTVANWRYVIGKTTTPFFMLCGAHDKWDPRFVEKLLPAFEDKKIMLSYPRSGCIEADGREGKILRDNYTMANIEKPVERYLFILRRYRAPAVFFGIWRTEALKNSNLNFVSPTADIIILEQVAFEGEFKQYQEVLFWLREVRKEEMHDQMLRRQIAAARGKLKNEVNIFEIRTYYIIYVAESISIIFRRRYSLNILTQLWLVVNVIFLKLLYPYIMFVVGLILRALLPKEFFAKVKDFWHRNQYEY